ncbi:MAG: hypothetical protein F6K24_54510 [Okeania sp. SIO2D1]|nr:hypothetical protein [Okeania sp. SIO2D1]
MWGVGGVGEIFGNDAEDGTFFYTELNGFDIISNIQVGNGKSGKNISLSKLQRQY